MGYVIEFRDESGYDEVMDKLYKAKKALMEVCEEMESNSEMGERRGGSSGYRRGMSYRGGSGGSMGYRDDYDMEDGSMSMRRGGRYRY